MDSNVQLSIVSLHTIGLPELRIRWGWFVGLGALLVVLGTLALGASVTMTLVTMVFVGWLMVIGGLLQTLHAFTCKGWSGFFLDLLSGTLYAVVGFLIVAHPGATAMALTLLIAALLVFGGVFRIIAAVAVRFPNWGWLLLHGVVNLLLGIAIFNQWPLSGLWVIGVFIGIDMLFNGWSLVMMGLALKSLPSRAEERQTAA